MPKSQLGGILYIFPPGGNISTVACVAPGISIQVMNPISILDTNLS